MKTLPLNYYYEAIQLTVNTSGYYMLSTKSELYFDPYGYLYEHYFDPYNPHPTLITENADACYDTEFKMTYCLQFSVVYVLIVTTRYPGEHSVGNFSVIAHGPADIRMKHIGMSIII